MPPIVVKKLHQAVIIVISCTNSIQVLRRAGLLLATFSLISILNPVFAESGLRHAALNRLAKTEATATDEAALSQSEWLSSVVNDDVVLGASGELPAASDSLGRDYTFNWNRQDLGSRVKRDYELRERNVIRKLVGERWSNHLDVDIRKRPKIELQFGF